MRGTYVLVIMLEEPLVKQVGALGEFRFPEGIYAYVGSAQMGIEARVLRHRRKTKKLRWHIDHFLENAVVMCTVSIPIQGKEHECAVAQSLLDTEGACVVADGFGSSDCHCHSHLIYFGDVEMEAVTESIAWNVSMLDSVYLRSM